ncbi:hypothetical protein U2I54_00045 [Bacillus pseudomycoides]|uniref:O-antigen polymerase n=1 Tax=Bacillus bingmayongensis TaxID=1150157 RepID=A0ABU5JQ33_9BACI|nr:hypothetical protein [Bacillus pseudomycoides]
MRKEKFKDFKKEGHHRGERYRGKDVSQQRGPKTFRRGRAIAFLEMMNLKRATIKQQLEAPEFQSIHQILVGELKAIDMVINEFIQLFEIHESEATETSVVERKDSLENSEKGMDLDETNK